LRRLGFGGGTIASAVWIMAGCQAPTPERGKTPDSLGWFAGMIDHCCDFADAAKAQGRPIVGIMCEFTPREIILAAGGVPVCLCGGSAATIPAAEQFLPANLCPLIKSTFGYHVQGSNPFLNQADLVVAETTCDGKKKMFELMGASKPMYVLELPQKSDDVDALEHWTREVRKFKEHLEQRLKTAITDEKLRGGIRLMNRERGLRRRLADLMMADNPRLTGRQLLEFKSIISGIEADLQQYEQAIRFFGDRADGSQKPTGDAQGRTVAAEVEAQEPRVESAARTRLEATLSHRMGEGEGERRVRVLLTGVPIVHGAERVLDLIENCGAVVVCMENCTGLKPIIEDVDESENDQINAIARKYYHVPC